MILQLGGIFAIKFPLYLSGICLETWDILGWQFRKKSIADCSREESHKIPIGYRSCHDPLG